MRHVNKLTVKYNNKIVGTLAMFDKFHAAFEYNNEWIANGFSIDPLNLPLYKKLFTPDVDTFDGLFGVFNDSLPDGWGRLLFDRKLVQNRIDPNSLNPLDMLSLIGNSGRGALEYCPAQNETLETNNVDLDYVAEECAKIFESQPSRDFEYIYKMAGSSGGARPKVFCKINNEDWIVKFPSSLDPKNICQMEYDYFKCAQNCGIEVPDFQLLTTAKGKKYFAIKRFDRNSGSGKTHMISASSLFNVSHRVPALDYNNLFEATAFITKNCVETKRLYKLMCFNVFAHNRDDHSNNFTFVYDGEWRLSPAYDLTYSSSLNGEHATTINGEGLAPSIDDLLAVAKTAGLPRKWAKDQASSIQEIVNDCLKQYL